MSPYGCIDAVLFAMLNDYMRNRDLSLLDVGVGRICYFLSLAVSCASYLLNFLLHSSDMLRLKEGKEGRPADTSLVIQLPTGAPLRAAA